MQISEWRIFLDSKLSRMEMCIDATGEYFENKQNTLF